jgi:hypothetical protein
MAADKASAVADLRTIANAALLCNQTYEPLSLEPSEQGGLANTSRGRNLAEVLILPSPLLRIRRTASLSLILMERRFHLGGPMREASFTSPLLQERPS